MGFCCFRSPLFLCCCCRCRCWRILFPLLFFSSVHYTQNVLIVRSMRTLEYKIRSYVLLYISMLRKTVFQLGIRIVICCSLFRNPVKLKCLFLKYYFVSFHRSCDFVCLFTVCRSLNSSILFACPIGSHTPTKRKNNFEVNEEKKLEFYQM